MGGDTLKVSMKLFEKNRKRLCTALKDQKNLPKKSFVLLQGGQQINQDSTDVELVFRQVIISHKIKTDVQTSAHRNKFISFFNLIGILFSMVLWCN